MTDTYDELRKDIMNAIQSGWSVAAMIPGKKVGDAMELATANVMRIVSPEGMKHEGLISTDDVAEVISSVFKADITLEIEPERHEVEA